MNGKRPLFLGESDREREDRDKERQDEKRDKEEAGADDRTKLSNTAAEDAE